MQQRTFVNQKPVGWFTEDTIRAIRRDDVHLTWTVLHVWPDDSQIAAHDLGIGPSYWYSRLLSLDEKLWLIAEGRTDNIDRVLFGNWQLSEVPF